MGALVERVVALPGEVVDVRDGRVLADGRILAEPYLEPRTTTSGSLRVRVPPGHRWVMGDDRGDRSTVGPSGR